MSPPKVWLVTGTSTGLGFDLVKHILSKGDLVIAAGRNPARLAALKDAGAATLKIDQNEPLDVLKKAVEEAVAVYGRIDIFVLNAAWVACGSIEERTPEETLAQYHTNVFGVLNLWRAILPHMRERKSGVIATVGSMGASKYDPLIGIYHSSKAAIRNLSLTLDNEISPFGIKTCLIEPGYFRTALLTGGESIMLPKTAIEDYRALNESVTAFMSERDGKQLGDPKRGAAVMYDVLTSTGMASGREIPKTLALGSDTVELVTKENEEYNRRIAEWASISSSTDFPPSERFY